MFYVTFLNNFIKLSKEDLTLDNYKGWFIIKPRQTKLS